MNGAIGLTGAAAALGIGMLIGLELQRHRVRAKPELVPVYGRSPLRRCWVSGGRRFAVYLIPGQVLLILAFRTGMGLF